MNGTTGGCSCRGEDLALASLGLLHLEGSSFLINRKILRARLDEFLLHPQSPDRVLPSSSVSTPLVTPGGRDFRFIDVGSILCAPRVSVDGALRKQLRAALRSFFGYSNGQAEAPCHVSQEASGNSSSSQVTGLSKPAPGTDVFGAARWLRDWREKEATLGGGDIRKTLGNVGLTGLAGWLLEYPVIYCCPCPSDGKRPEGESGPETGINANCLAATPLVVYTVRFEFARANAARQRESVSLFEAFSFSVPETAQDRTACLGEDVNDETGVSEDQKRMTTLDALRAFIDEFFGAFEAKVARHNDAGACVECSRDRERCILKLRVSERREILDRVAL